MHVCVILTILVNDNSYYSLVDLYYFNQCIGLTRRNKTSIGIEQPFYYSSDIIIIISFTIAINPVNFNLYRIKFL